MKEENKTIKCINCGREVKDLEKGCSYCNQRNKENIEQFNGEKDKIISEKNTIAYVFKILAWIGLVCGFILGCIIGKEYDVFVMIIIWVVYASSFLILMAISEVIQILHDIRAKIYKQK